jgi:uncharacterized protein
MRRDELNQPLHKRSLRQRLWEKRPSALVAAYGLTICGMIGGASWVVKQPLPFAGEPIVIVAVPPPEQIKTAAIEPVPEAPTTPVEVAEDQNQPDETAAIDTVDVASEPPAKPTHYDEQATVYHMPSTPLAKAPNFNVMESVDIGMLPKISSTGSKPSEVYAKTVPMGILHSEAPKIIIILGGMGLNEKLTSQAVKDLPAEVTFAYAPYGNNLQTQVDKARAAGHEVLLQLPLEPVGYPANNPGPKTLLADAAPAANVESLLWHMSRFTGYTGVINYMGGRYLASATAIKPVLAELRKRGVLFFEDGSLALSATDDVANAMHMPVRRGQTVIDANPDPEAITSALNLLEEEANKNGVAIGTGSGLDLTIKTLSDWSKAASDRGVIFMPASAAFKGRLG